MNYFIIYRYFYFVIASLQNIRNDNFCPFYRAKFPFYKITIAIIIFYKIVPVFKIEVKVSYFKIKSLILSIMIKFFQIITESFINNIFADDFSQSASKNCTVVLS